MGGPGLREVPAGTGQPAPSRVARNRIGREPLRTGGSLRLARMFPRCGHTLCSSGRIRLWRSPHAPIFEGRWACSPECLRAMVDGAISREGQGEGSQPVWNDRKPLSLILLEQGRISEEQLRQAGRDCARSDGAGREGTGLESWLRNSGLLSEAALTRAISAQWNCPVFSLSEKRPEEMGSAIPPFLSEALGALPVRVSAGKLLYLAFSGPVDRSLSYAVEHITGLRIAAGVARESEFRREQARFLSGHSPRTRFLDAEDRRALSGGIAAWLEQERPIEARLARIRQLWWLRIWRREPGDGALPACEAVEDLLAMVGGESRN